MADTVQHVHRIVAKETTQGLHRFNPVDLIFCSADDADAKAALSETGVVFFALVEWQCAHVGQQ